MFAGFQHRRLTGASDIRVNAVIAGDGPPVLLLHGYPQTSAMWAEIAPVLAQNFTVIVPDLRGYGDSDKPTPDDPRAYTFREMARDQICMMRQLGIERFHVVGHDRGGRVAHRLALDHPAAVASLSVLDIVPTHTLFSRLTKELALVYWHWFFLAQPAPFPAAQIAAAPDAFFETCLTGWGRAPLESFPPNALAAYRRAWRNAKMIRATCTDYRAAATLDLDHDEADLNVQIDVPTLVLFGADGAMAQHFDVAECWREKCRDVEADCVPGGHFFPDLEPEGTAKRLTDFLARQTI
ncbi:MAG: alpha/beta hydrolase [Pseudomonadota bacterium]